MATWDLLDEDCAAIGDWNDNDGGTGVSEVDPAGQFRLDTNLGAAANGYCHRWRDIASPPDKFAYEIRTYFDDIGAIGDTDFAYFTYGTASWSFRVYFCSDGLFVTKTGAANIEVGTNLVKEGGTAAWQVWRFEVDKSGGEDVAVVEVFLDGVSQGTVDCDWEVAGTDGRTGLGQWGNTTDNMVSHYDYIRLLTGVFVEKERNIVYDLFQWLGRTRDVVYDLILYLTRERSIVYDQVLYLSRTRDIEYDLFQWLGKTRDIVYDLFQWLGKERSINYDLELYLSKTRDVLYDLELCLTSEKIILYDLIILIDKLAIIGDGWVKEDALEGVSTREGAPTGDSSRMPKP